MKSTPLLLLTLALGLASCSGNKPAAENTEDNTANDPFEAAAGETKIAINDSVTPMVFVPVKGGTFEMGDPNGVTHNDEISETPAHKVTVSGFQICKIEVTQDQWQAVMGKNPSKEADDPQKPVDNVSWNDTQEFIAKLGKLTGHQFRLPTEAEWEYAARGGSKSKGTVYAGSDNAEDVANFHADTNPNAGRLATVGILEPNELGLYDMSGNAAEWVQDFYAPYPSDEQTDPCVKTGEYHVYRGGHCDKNADECTVTIRMKFAPVLAASRVGLRLVLVK
ncbi:MAG: SUMF1/EgtB/PvdO family nonheme iron enzyme [Bacteroidaceae bacterium]|nr:SUMF1/EgtB/PvdO family nonheme iron enzyme [Bacteroidaceae bacterium]